MTKPGYAEVFRNNPFVEHLILPGPSLGELVQACRSGQAYDLIVDLHGSLRSRLATFFLPAGTTVRFRKHSLRRRALVAGLLGRRNGFAAGHVAGRYLDSLRTLGIRDRGECPELFLDNSEREKMAARLAMMGIAPGEGFAVLAPGARWKNKMWPYRGFASVGVLLGEREQLKIVVAGDNADRSTAERLMELLPAGSVNLAGTTGIRELAALLSLSRIAVGNDSAPGHLAAAVGTPALSIFGPTIEGFGFTPRGEQARTVSLDLPCRPCSLHGGRKCPRKDRRCLDDLEPERVFQAAQQLLTPENQMYNQGHSSPAAHQDRNRRPASRR